MALAVWTRPFFRLRVKPLFAPTRVPQLLLFPNQHSRLLHHHILFFSASNLRSVLAKGESGFLEYNLVCIPLTSCPCCFPIVLRLVTYKPQLMRDSCIAKPDHPPSHHRPSQSFSFNHGHRIEASILGDYHRSQNCDREVGLFPICASA